MSRTTAGNKRTGYLEKSGQILEMVLQGKIVRLEKHGRAIAEIKPIEEENK